MVSVKCFICGKERNKTPSSLKATKHNFCCRKCYHIYREYIKHNSLDTEYQKKIKFFGECRRAKYDKENSKA